MTIELPITNTARRYGYVTWPASQDSEVRELVGARESIKVWLGDSCLGEKRVDMRHRRISLGYSRTRSLDSSATTFHLTQRPDGSIAVRVK